MLRITALKIVRFAGAILTVMIFCYVSTHPVRAQTTGANGKIDNAFKPGPNVGDAATNGGVSGAGNVSDDALGAANMEYIACNYNANYLPDGVCGTSASMNVPENPPDSGTTIMGATDSATIKQAKAGP